MQVNVISNTKQEFNGKAYYSCKSHGYYAHGSERLHRVVWQYHNGEIPKGFHIHHKDGNPANNQIENLALLKPFDHLSAHAKSRVEYNLRHIEDIREAAAQWHHSEEGRAWHGVHAKEMWEHREPVTYKCDACGKEFKTKNLYSPNSHTFCSNNCKAAFRRRSGVDNETRICAYCGQPFTTNRYSKARYCSHDHATKARWGK